MSSKSLSTLIETIYDESLDVLTCVRMARMDYKYGDIDSCVARLKVDADKLRTINERLYNFVIAYIPRNSK